MTIIVDGVKTETLSFNGLNLIPGEKQEYYINLLSQGSRSFNVGLNFQQIKEGGLSKYVNVCVKHNDTFFNDSLINLYSSDNPISFDCSFSSNQAEKILVQYSIPLDVNNEAQNKFADFDILLSIK